MKKIITLFSITLLAMTTCLSANNDCQDMQTYPYCSDCNCCPCTCETTPETCTYTCCDPCDPCAPVCGTSCGVNWCAIGVGVVIAAAVIAIALTDDSSRSTHSGTGG